MKFGKLFLPSFLLLGLACTVANAQQYGGLGISYLYGYGAGAGIPNYATATYNASMPYFALRPPVYYGQRYARPYGASPYAAWPQLQANSAYAPTAQAHRSVCQPAVIVNPHVSDKDSSGTQGDGIVVAHPVKPLVIENPYFDAESVQYTATRK